MKRTTMSRSLTGRLFTLTFLNPHPSPAAAAPRAERRSNILFKVSPSAVLALAWPLSRPPAESAGKWLVFKGTAELLHCTKFDHFRGEPMRTALPAARAHLQPVNADCLTFTTVANVLVDRPHVLNGGRGGLKPQSAGLTVSSLTLDALVSPGNKSVSTSTGCRWSGSLPFCITGRTGTRPDPTPSGLPGDSDHRETDPTRTHARTHAAALETCPSRKLTNLHFRRRDARASPRLSL